MAKIIRSNDNKVKVKDIRQGDIFKYDNCYYIKTSLGQVTCSSNSYEMFLSEVDHDKYPDVEQKYRFELIEEREDNA